MDDMDNNLVTTGNYHQLKFPEYTCPVHGDQQNIIGISFEFSGEISQAMKLRNGRKYCICCLADMMEQFCCQLEEKI